MNQLAQFSTTRTIRYSHNFNATLVLSTTNRLHRYQRFSGSTCRCPAGLRNQEIIISTKRARLTSSTTLRLMSPSTPNGQSCTARVLNQYKRLIVALWNWTMSLRHGHNLIPLLAVTTASRSFEKKDINILICITTKCCL